MNTAFLRPSGLLFGIGLGLASLAPAGQTPTLGLISGSGANGGDSVDGIYSSPYQMSLNLGSGAVTIAADCDDWADNINDGQTWYVTSTALSAITGGGTNSASQPAHAVNTNVYYGSDSAPVAYDYGSASVALTQEEKYVAATYLAVELNSGTLSSAQRGDLSLALWDIFNPTLDAIDGGTNYGSPNSNIGGNTVAQGDLLAAIHFGQGYAGGSIDGYTATIYTPLLSGNAPCYNLANGGCGETVAGGGRIASSGGNGVPQEFIALTYVPEPSTWAFLGFDLAGAGMMGMWLRRKRRH